jgi:hypothetical protein
MWLSKPRKTTVLRFPGNRFKAAHNTSLPKQGRVSFSMALVSGSRDATSEMVFPNPLEHCVVSMVGILRI